MKNEIMNKNLAESHRRQFNGEDYQKVAFEISVRHDIACDSDEYAELESSPDPGCECGFCKGADWE